MNILNSFIFSDFIQIESPRMRIMSMNLNKPQKTYMDTSVFAERRKKNNTQDMKYNIPDHRLWIIHNISPTFCI